jgi:hypothetical protein
LFIVTALLALLGRSSLRLLNMVFGWAIVLFFGKLPENRQVYLSVMAFGSVLWLLVLLGLPFPAVGVLLLTFVPLPKWVESSWVRAAMLVTALLVPLGVGAVSLRLRSTRNAPVGAARTSAVLLGFPYTLGMAAALLLMTLFAPILRLRAFRRRWATQHVSMSVAASEYQAIVAEIRAALQERGWAVECGPASWMLRLPARVISLCAGTAVESLIQSHLMAVSTDRFEVVLHPADLVVTGRPTEVTRVRIALTERLAFSKAYMTWSARGNAFEDRLAALWRDVQQAGPGRPSSDGAPAALRKLDQDLETSDLPFGEWEVLYRKRLLVECALLRRDLLAGPAAEPAAETAP